MAQGRTTDAMAKVSLHHDSYRDAGVDTDEADAGLRKLTARIAETWPPAGAEGAVQLDIGYFANVVAVGGLGIAISTDGIGSKAVIASALEKYDTVGIDCVAMNVNDVICVGARPISMVDYIAIEKADANILDQISIGLCAGAKLAGISISGGETAQLKGMVHGFDLAGTAIGYVALDKILVGQDVKDGDAVSGIESNGVHSNGMTLTRRVFFAINDYKLSHRFYGLGCVDLADMHAVYNMGIGFCAVVAPEDADRAVGILGSNGKRAHRIGHAVSDARRRVTLPKQGLVGQGKHFRRV